jgi:LSD1 subclass zinc finger protein
MNIEPRELRCNACGAALHYEPGATVIKCAHCGTEYALETSAIEGELEFTIEEDGEAEVEAPAYAEPERPPFEDEALIWLREGKKIQAIKVVREYTGLGLRESKEYVEGLAVREGIALPPERVGVVAIVVAVVLVVVLCGAVWYFVAT